MGTGSDHPSGVLALGYARASTTKQHLERRLDALSAVGIPKASLHRYLYLAELAPGTADSV